MVLSMPRPFGMYALLALAWSTVGVFKFVAQRLLRAWRPREFDQACVEMRLTPLPPQRLLVGLVVLVLYTAAFWGLMSRMSYAASAAIRDLGWF